MSMAAARRPLPSRRPLLSLSVQYAVSASGKPSRAQFRRWARAALDHDARITLRIVGQKEGRTLNHSYRNRDYATNVLTFILCDNVPLEGDLALCAPVVAREARAQNKSIAAHYAHLTVHGVLHLQGYGHENDADAKVMESRETQIMAKLGYADPYQI
jgi:probable rRNA maturation factor